MSETEIKERRCAIVFVDNLRVLSLLLSHRREGGCIVVPVAEGLPEGYQVLSVYEDHASRAFGFVIRHESLATVEPGVQMPEIPVRWESVELATLEQIKKNEALMSGLHSALERIDAFEAKRGQEAPA